MDFNTTNFFIDILINIFDPFSDVVNFLVDLNLHPFLLFFLNPFLNISYFVAEFTLVFSVVLHIFLDFCQLGLNILHQGGLLDLLFKILGRNRSNLFWVNEVVQRLDVRVNVVKSALNIFTIADGQELIFDVLEYVFFELNVNFLKETSQLRCDLLLHLLVHPFSLSLHFLLEGQTRLLNFCIVFFFVLADPFLEISYLGL